MKIFLVKTLDDVGYDEYDSIVVIAKSIKRAIELSKEGCYNFRNNLKTKCIGDAKPNLKESVVLSSFNAG